MAIVTLVQMATMTAQELIGVIAGNVKSHICQKRESAKTYFHTMTQAELELSSDAADTLKRLQYFVKQAETRLTNANEALRNAINGVIPPALDGLTPDEILSKSRAEVKSAEDSYLRFSGALLNFDKNVSTERRDNTESITRAEAEKFFFSFGITMRGAVETAITRHAQESMEAKSPEGMYEIMSPIMRECFAMALSDACSVGVPEWVKTTIMGAL